MSVSRAQTEGKHLVSSISPKMRADAKIARNYQQSYCRIGQSVESVIGRIGQSVDIAANANRNLRVVALCTSLFVFMHSYSHKFRASGPCHERSQLDI